MFCAHHLSSPLTLLGALLLVSAWTGCGVQSPVVVVYAAQDRVFAEPVFRAFTAADGIEVRPIHDNEATKTTGLANRLLIESQRPRADVWWSNEEMRTRQLVRKGVLEPDWKSFGRRSRVLVLADSAPDWIAGISSLSVLTNPALAGRIAIAYPMFGTTATHFLVLRQRWGDEAWRRWCQALAANRPLLLDGNSLVVQRVDRGDAWIGMTDSDDVAFGRREGLGVVARPLPPIERLQIPNTVARVRKAPHPAEALRLETYLAGPWVESRLVEAGALEGGTQELEENPGSLNWEKLLDDLDTDLRFLQDTFVR